MKPRNQPGRPSVRSEAGVVVVEFAIIAVALFMVLFATMVFGLAVWEYNIVASAAKDGARWATVRGASSSSPATASAVANYVNGRVYGLAVAVTTTWPDSGSPPNAPGKRVRVQVATTFVPIKLLVPNNSLTLQSTAEMIIMR